MNELASYIDHTLLKPEATESQIRALCAEARQWRFASVCVNPRWAATAAEELRGSRVKVCTVIGFPLGASVSAVKEFEARRAVADGADELDMVVSVGDLKAGRDEYVRSDIAAVVRGAQGRTVKVIIEACLLTDEEKARACRLAAAAGADFVKTSTGFSKGGATVHDVALMRAVVGPDVGVKAAGGIHTRAEAEEMIAAGATRIGASAGAAICRK
ncbi:deoxyribose-phosphate aldolase [Pyramidobacter piscolens W5455]|uniref:Deoxyribose-phosphate aldolase n=2 Tax=Pyramidobacter piscolens TaxID=638849 RepID=A0ABM9ZWK6_9BACT|nr:deoxyribose-phosphate aldolase [Pyramidobacter piscolens]EFB91312.1 deoxyribose-phosphate aldolase [Pyramidobacter piscolens W5455]BDF78302.1 deoxyribose-phosphate aldolase [Pyramidobacter piscolens]